MSRKFLISFFASAVFLLAVTVSASAQFAPVTGTVQMEKADGTKAPVAGALVEVYRTDIKAGFPSNKTDKKGFFAFAGVPLGATFTFAVSAPGAAPDIFPNIKAGQENLVITLHPGDGRKFTEAEVRAGVSASVTGTPEMTAEEKKAREEFEKQKAAVEAKNSKIETNTKIVEAALKAGNDAYSAKDYDTAIAKFTEGINAEPDYVGVTPVLLNNRGAAYDNRAVETFNKFARSPDVSVKSEAYTKTKADIVSSIGSYKMAWEIIQKAPASDILNPQAVETSKVTALKGAKGALKHAVQTEQVDPVMIESAKVLLPEYEKVETDPVKKAEARMIIADLYRVTGDSDNAIPEYKKILETSPDNLDALAGVGFSLVNNGYIKNDKAQMQEGSNYLQKFVSAAPDTNKFKTDAAALIESLKKEQNVAPQKVTTTKKKP
jgi:tetratricopeptide (TPR) repeat protein